MFLRNMMHCSLLRSLCELEIVLGKCMNINGNQLHLVQGVDNSEAWGNLCVPATISFFFSSPPPIYSFMKHIDVTEGLIKSDKFICLSRLSPTGP